MKLSNEMKFKYLPLLAVIILIAWGVFYVFNRSVPTVDAPVAATAAVERPAVPSDSLADSLAAPAAQPADGAWFVRCNPVDDAQTPDGGGDEAANMSAAKAGQCEIFQRLNQAQTGMRFVEFAVGAPRPTDGIARGVIILPLGIYLPDGVLLQIGDGPSFKAAIRSCTRNGCVSHVNLSRDLIQMLESSETLTLHLKADNGQKLQVKMPLKGFAPRFAEISTQP